MKKRVQGLIAGVLVGVILMSGTGFAKQLNEWAEVFYNNIKIYVDGGEIVPKDANGNLVEPFIMNGTTYLPVRAVASALGKDVEWDGLTSSVFIGKKDYTQPDNYLQKIQYIDYKEGAGGDDFAIINGTVTDYNNDVYTNGLMFYKYDSWYKINEDSDGAQQSISYPLNSQYSTLTGKIVLPKSFEIATWDKNNNPRVGATDVWFYGDGKLLHKANSVVASLPFSFDIDVRGVNQLTVKLKTDGDYQYVALTNLALYK